MKTTQENQIPTLTTIQHIKDGTINPKALDKDARQQCIEVLLTQGYTHAQLAQIMNCSDKTIQRDMCEIRRRNSLTPHPELAKEIVGEMLQKVRNYEANLNQLARAKDGSVSEKAQAQFLGWRVFKECVEKLQTLGYLPLKPQEIRGDFYHMYSEADESEKSIVEIQTIIKDIESNLQNNADPVLQAEVDRLKLKFEKAKLASDAQTILEKQRQIEQNKGGNENV